MGASGSRETECGADPRRLSQRHTPWRRHDGSASADLDHGAASQLFQVALGLGLEPLVAQLLAHLALLWRLAADLLLGADCERLDALQRDIRRGEVADRRLVEDVALLRGNVERGAGDRLAHGDVAQRSRHRDSFFAALEPGAQSLQLLGARIEYLGRGAT